MKIKVEPVVKAKNNLYRQQRQQGKSFETVLKKVMGGKI